MGRIMGKVENELIFSGPNTAVGCVQFHFSTWHTEADKSMTVTAMMTIKRGFG